MFVLYILIAAVGIGFLILSHEFGHFVVAKLCNVKVEGFSIGFGPEIVGFTRGETRYSLRVMPLGGYVKMMGDEPGSEDAGSERSFLGQSYTRKSLIIVAGSGANMLLSLALFAAAFRIGVEFPAAKIGHVAYGSAAYYAGIESGDRILEIDGRGDVDFAEFATKVALADPGRPVRVVIERDGRRFERELYPLFSPELGRGEVGLGLYYTLTIEDFFETSVNRGTPKAPKYEKIANPTKAAGVPKGATIELFNTEEVRSWSDFERRMAANGLKPYTLSVAVHDGPAAGKQRKTFEITPVRSPSPLLGIGTFTNRVDKVEESSLAGKMGLAVGDEIVGLRDMEVADYLELRVNMAQRLRDLPPLVISRGGKRLELTWPRRLGNEAVFFEGFTTETPPIAACVEPDSPAELMGILPGDVITSVDGGEVKSFVDVITLLAESTGDTVSVKWLRGAQEHEGTFQPVGVDVVPRPEQILRKLGLPSACSMGARKAWDFGAQVYLIIRKALRGQAGIAKNVGGPVSIARWSYQIARRSSPSFIFFLAILSVNFGVINLLPIPVLDGGLLAIFTLEKAKGSPFSPGMQAVIQYAGLAIIVTLFIFITYQDIARIFW